MSTWPQLTGNSNVFRQSYVSGFLDVSGVSILRNDVSMNSRLFVGSDVSFGNNLYTVGRSILQGDVSMNSRLFVGGDVSMNSRLFISNDVSMNGNLYSLGRTVHQGDVSMNSRMYVNGDASFNNRLFVTGNIYLPTGSSVYVGGAVISTGGGNSNFYNDVSMASRLLVYGDVSMNSRLFVGGDASLNNRLFVSGDVSMNGNLYNLGRTIHQGDVSMNTRLFVSNDVSLNANLYTLGRTVKQGDVSMNSRLFINGDVSMNSRLFVTSDVSMNARLFVSNDVSLNANLYTLGRTVKQGDVSMNSRLFVGGNVSVNTHLFVAGDLSLNDDIYVFRNTIQQGDVSMNSRLFINGDVSMNSRLFVRSDVSMNGRLFVSNDVSMNGNLYTLGRTVLQGDLSLNSRLFVGNDVIIAGRLNVYEYTNRNIVYTNVTTTEYTFIVAEDMSLNGRLNVNFDASLNARLFVGSDVSMNGNLYTLGRTIKQGDVSMNSRLFVGGNVSINTHLFVTGDLSLNDDIYVFRNTIQQGDVSMNSRLFINGDVSMNSRLFVRSDVSMNGRLFVSNDVSMNGNLYTLGRSVLQGDVSMNSRLFVTGNIYLPTGSSIYVGAAVISTGGSNNFGTDVSMASRLFVYGDVSMGGNLTLSSVGTLTTGFSEFAFTPLAITSTSGVPTTGTFVYSAMSDTGFGVAAGGAGVGLYKTNDGGITWSVLNASLTNVGPVTDGPGTCLHIDTTGQYILYSLTNSSPGFYYSSNYGASFQACGGTLATSNTGYNHTLTMAGGSGYGFMMGANIGSNYTTNYGATWTASTTAPTINPYGAVCMSADGKFMAKFTYGGSTALYRSTNFGNTWQSVTNTATGNFWCGAASSTGQYMVMPNSTSPIIYTSSTYGLTWRPVTVTGATISYQKPCYISSTGQYQYVYGAFSTNYGATWTASTNYIDAMSKSSKYILRSTGTGLYYRISTFGPQINLGGDASFNGNVSVGGNLSISGNTLINGNTSITGVKLTPAALTTTMANAITIASMTTSAMLNNGGAFSCSSTGQYSCNGYGYSTNYGTTYTSIGINTTTYTTNMGCFVSGTGQYMTTTVTASVGSSTNAIYISSNYGSTWSTITFPVPPKYAYMACNDDGTITYLRIVNTSNVSFLYKSSNFGTSWTNITGSNNVAGNQYQNVLFSLNPTGQYITMNLTYSTNEAANALMTSSDYGVTWTTVAIPGSYGLNGAATQCDIPIISDDGKYVYAKVSNTSYISSNYGVSFTTITDSITGVNIYRPSATSNFGYIFVLGPSPNIYYSTNYASTWTAVNIGTFTNNVGGGGTWPTAGLNINKISKVGNVYYFAGQTATTGTGYISSLQFNSFTTTVNNVNLTMSTDSLNQIDISGNVSMNSSLFLGTVKLSQSVGITFYTPSTTYTPNTASSALAGWSNGGINWTTTQTSFIDNAPMWRAFNGPTGVLWKAGGVYNGTTGVYSSSNSTVIAGVGTILGEWGTLTSSSSIIMNSFNFTYEFTGRLCSSFYIVGASSTSPASWTPVIYGIFTGLPAFTSSTTPTYYIPTGTVSAAYQGTLKFTTYGNAASAFSNFRIVIPTVFGTTYGASHPDGANTNFTMNGWNITFGNTNTNTFTDGTLNIVSTNTDISGTLTTYGTVTTRSDINANNRLYVQGDVSMNSRLFVNGDVSMNSRLFVTSDVSMNARLFVSNDVSMNGNLYTLGRTIKQGDVSMNSRLFVGGNVAVNTHLFVAGDLSLNDDIYVFRNTIQQGDVSMNSRLFINGDVSMNSRLFVRSDVSMNGRLFVSNDVSMNANLFVNNALSVNNFLNIGNRNGYINQYPVDVSGTVNLRGTVNPINLIDGSTLFTNTPALDFSNNFATIFKSVTLGGTNAQVAMSADGQIQYASVSAAFIYISYNHGSTWTQLPAPGSINTIATSATGQYVSGGSNTFYYSSNYGASWSSTTLGGGANCSISSNPISATGQYQMVTYDGYNRAYISTNYGTSFDLTVSTVSQSRYLALSATGQYQVGITNTNIYTYSTNYGVSWTAGTQGGTVIAMSSTGQYQAIYATSGYINISRNYGITWTQVGTIQTWTSIAISANGQYMVACGSGTIFTSLNYGAVWKQAITGLSVGSITMSSNAQYITATTSGGIIYTFTTPYSNLSVSNTAVFGGDVSMNSRLFVNGDVSMNSRLFVRSDVSMNGRLFVSNDVSMNGNLYTLGRTILQGDVSMNSRLFVGGNVSINTHLFVTGDLSLNDDIYVFRNTIQQGDVSMNSRLFINGDVSMNSRLFVRSDVSMNGRLFVSNDVSMNANLFVNNALSVNNFLNIGNRDGYINQYPVDVSGTVNIRGTVNPISLIDGSTLFSNTPALDFSNNMATIFKQTTIGGINNRVVMSATGQYQYATNNTAFVYISNDHGSTWRQNATPIIMTNVGTSGTGQYVTGGQATSGNLLCKSTDYGTTWVIDNHSYGYSVYTVAISATGQYQLVSWDGYNRTYSSSTYGVTWGDGVGGLNQARSVAMSATGQYQAGTNNNGASGAYTYSTNYGNTWTQGTATGTFIAMSATGQYQALCATSNYINISTNYGITWRQVGSSQSWNSIAISANGQYMVACGSGNIFTSLDYGNVWKQSITGLGLGSITMSSNAQYITAVAGGGIIYTFTTPYSNLSVSNTAVFGGDVSMNARLFIGNDLFITGRLNVYEYTNRNIIYTNVTTTSYTLIVAEDMSLNGRLNVNYDVSLNQRLFVGSDVSMNGNLYNLGRTIHQGDVSMNSRLFVFGNIGLGTNNPTYTLDVTGNIRATSTIFSSNNQVATLVGTETLTNKTLTTPIISTIYNTTSANTLTLPTATDTLVGRATTDTLTNKTLTTPVIASLYTSGSNLLTFPSSISDNVVTRTSTDTLTNKTLTAPILTTPTLGVATAASINKVAFTSPATAATLTLADGSTLATVGAFPQTLTATATTNVTLPTAGTLATLTGTETLTNKTITAPIISGISYVDRMSELIFNSASNATVFDYNNGSTFYVATPAASNFTASFPNVPTTINRTFVASLILNSASNKSYATAVTVNGAAATLLFNNGASSINVSNATVIVQTFAFVVGSAGTVTFVFSSVSSYQV